MLTDGKEISFRMLWTGVISLMMGRNKGKQAPTIPSEDSTIGQYRVGVNRSFGLRVSYCHLFGLANVHTCKICVIRIGLLRLIVISGLPYLTVIKKKSLLTRILYMITSFVTLAAMVL